MDLRIVSHACLAIEHNEKLLVVDPWLKGPVYWGSWWHYPEPVYDERLLNANYIYLTHWHFDHFHPASLSLFNKDCHVLVPAFPISNMVQELQKCGFTKITELVHGRPFELAPDFVICSYQIQYQDDSVLCARAGNTTVVDLNDAKPLAAMWRKIRKDYPEVTFMLRSHSPAWSYPTAYTFEDPSEAIPVSSETYVSAFGAAARILEPKYAVPFASGICHLHRESVAENKNMVPALEVKKCLDGNPIAGTEVMIMPAGSTWSDVSGFNVRPVDLELQAFVAEKVEAYRSELAKIYAKEDKWTLNFEEFQSYFQKVIRSMRGVNLFLPVIWTFVVSQQAATKTDQPPAQKSATEYWTIDFRGNNVTRSDTEPATFTSRITMHEGVLANALKNGTFTNIDISKRWKVYVRKGGVMKHILTTVLVSLYEAGYMDFKNLFRSRFFSGWRRRFPEILDYGNLVFTVIGRGPKKLVNQVVQE